MHSIVLELELSTHEPNALAEFLKRSGYSTFRAFVQSETEPWSTPPNNYGVLLQATATTRIEVPPPN